MSEGHCQDDLSGDHLRRPVRLIDRAPLIETDRLILRGHQREDLDACTAMWAEPIVTRYIGGRPFSREEVWARLLRYVGHWALLGYGFWALSEKSSGRFVGELGFADFQRDISPSLDGMPELGWVLVPTAHGRGYATEAVQAALAWGEQHLETNETVCLIHPDNLSSLRVAAKCGFHESRRTTYKEQPALLFTRPNPSSA